jgi:hypothetical protein
MKVSDIVALERSGTGTLHLLKEGKFWRAWEQSAHLFHTHIKAFQIVKRLFKNQNEELVYLGFPENVLAVFLGQAAVKGWRVEQDKDLVRIIGVPMVADFAGWKAAIAIKIVEPVAPLEAPEPASSKLGLHRADFLPAYKLGYECVLDLVRVTEKLPREHRFTLGESLRKSSLAFLLGLWKAAAGREKANQLLRVEDAIDETRLLLRLCSDLRLMDLALFARTSQKVELLARQVVAWRACA